MRTTGYCVLAFLFLVLLAGAGANNVSTEDKPLRIAVLPFAVSGDFDGVICASLFAAQLARSEKITVLERARLEDLLSEQHLQLSGFVDPEAVVNVGKITGAAYLLMGEIVEDSNTIIISTRLVDCETGEILLPDTASTGRDAYLHTIINMACDCVYALTGDVPSLGGESLVPQEMLDAMGDFKGDPNALMKNSEFGVKVALNEEGDTPVYHLGKNLSIKVTVERDSYLYIFNISKTGGAKVIFPNMGARDNFIRAGQSVVFPAADATYEWTLGAPAEGLEYIIAVATETPVEFVSGFSDLIANNAFPEIGGSGSEFLAKQINVTLKAEKAHSFGFGFARFYLAE